MGAAAAPRRAPAPARRAPARRKPARSAPARRTSGARAGGGRAATARSAPRAAPTRSAPRPAATKRRAPKRTSSARPHARSARQGFAQPALAGAALLPHAAMSAAGAVRDLSDSSAIHRLTRGRGWIALLCALLVGIVTLNVVSLSLNAGSGRVGQQIADLERANSGLRAELAEELSSARIAQLAPAEGYYVPSPDAVGYLTARDEDLEKLLRLFSNEMVLTRAAPPVDTTPAPVTAYTEPYTDPSAAPAPEAAPAPGAPPAPVTAAPPAPVAPAPAPTAPVPAPVAPTGGTGGTGGTGL